MNTVKQIAAEIKAAGGRAFVVGGYVRDMVLGRDSKDIDVEVYGITPEVLVEILSRYGNPKLVGQSFGVYHMDGYDFSFPRTERKSGVGHKAFEVEINPNMSHEDAARRRDLTINAMMFCPLTGITLDPYKGLDDLKRGLIRHVDSKTFAEDPLRVLRVAQFAARFEFEISAETEELCKTLIEEMKTLSKERFYIEIEKIMMKASKPSIAFHFLLKIGVLEALFPELYELTKIEQGLKYHPEGAIVRRVK
jgi:tRNA nucleotidyltransferase (CCA-adding enzyme)